MRPNKTTAIVQHETSIGSAPWSDTARRPGLGTGDRGPGRTATLVVCDGCLWGGVVLVMTAVAWDVGLLP